MTELVISILVLGVVVKFWKPLFRFVGLMERRADKAVDKMETPLDKIAKFRVDLNNKLKSYDYSIKQMFKLQKEIEGLKDRAKDAIKHWTNVEDDERVKKHQDRLDKLKKKEEDVSSKIDKIKKGTMKIKGMLAELDTDEAYYNASFDILGDITEDSLDDKMVEISNEIDAMDSYLAFRDEVDKEI